MGVTDYTTYTHNAYLVYLDINIYDTSLIIIVYGGSGACIILLIIKCTYCVVYTSAEILGKTRKRACKNVLGDGRSGNYNRRGYYQLIV